MWVGIWSIKYPGCVSKPLICRQQWWHWPKTIYQLDFVQRRWCEGAWYTGRLWHNCSWILYSIPQQGRSKRAGTGCISKIEPGWIFLPVLWKATIADRGINWVVMGRIKPTFTIIPLKQYAPLWHCRFWNRYTFTQQFWKGGWQFGCGRTNYWSKAIEKLKKIC